MESLSRSLRRGLNVEYFRNLTSKMPGLGGAGSGGFRGGTAIGLDIDSGAVKAMQVSRSGGSRILQHVGYRRLPSGIIVDGEVADHDLLAAELQEFWSQHAFKGRSVYLGISNQKIVVRLLEFPRMAPEDLQTAISFEAQDQIPMPIEEAVLDYVVLGPLAEGSDLDRILIVAAQKDMVSRYTSAIRTAGLRPVGVDVKALSLLRSTLPETLFEDEGAILLLDISSEITNLCVAQGGSPALTRFIPGGSTYFAQTMAEAADLSEDEAQRYLMNPKLNLGHDTQAEAEVKEVKNEEEVEGFDPATLYDLRRGLEESAQVLAEDVQRSVEYHYSQPGARDIAQIFVSGEGALVRGIDGYLGDLLEIPADKGHPLSRFAENRSNISDEQLQTMEPVLAIAAGLALEES